MTDVCETCGERAWKVSDEGNCRSCASDSEEFPSAGNPFVTADDRLREEKKRKVNHVW